MSLDIVLYAVVAAALLARLWFVLGRRGEDEPQRPNPFVKPAPNPEDEESKKNKLAAAEGDPPRLLKAFHAPPDSLAGGLERIAALDSSFDEKIFLRDVSASFQAIVENFAKGDLKPIESKLGPGVLERFRQALEARQKAGQTMQSRILRVKDVETTAAKTEDATAMITVRFVSEQENMLKDGQGKIVGGAEGAIEEITDVWTFSRDTKSPNTDWILTQTHS